MKNLQQLFILISACFIISTGLSGQVNFHSQIGYTYMQHSALHGINLGAGIKVKTTSSSFIALGFSFNYGEGNRNFDPKDKQEYSIEYDNYVPPYQAFPVKSNQFSHFQELEIRTSNTYQFSGALAYGTTFSVPYLRQLTLEGGVYLSYVNKSYIADVIEDASLTWDFFGLKEDIEYDIVIPFYNRYVDFGPYASAQVPVYNSSTFLVSAKASYYMSGLDNGWLNVGLDFRF